MRREIKLEINGRSRKGITIETDKPEVKCFVLPSETLTFYTEVGFNI